MSSSWTMSSTTLRAALIMSRHTASSARSSTSSRGSVARRARTLSWVSLIWMSAEGITGLIAGVQAQSISLLAWALGSVIEGLASVIVIGRFTGTRTMSETAESRAQQAVAVSFFLAPYITLEAVRDPTTSGPSSSSRQNVVRSGQVKVASGTSRSPRWAV